MAASSAKLREHPFSPGTGHTPEHVVGRQKEFALLEEALQGIDRSEIKGDGLLERASMAPLVLTGPRGVGKTMMLTWMEDRAREMGIPVARLEHVKDLGQGNALRRLLNAMVQDVDEALLKSLLSLNLYLADDGLGLDLKKAAHSYEQVLLARLRQGPVALLMDEAHHYQDEYMEFILRVGEQLIDERYPLVMLVVGTPDMLSYLHKIDAGFLERSEVIHINSLTTEESKSGLGKPFADRGIEVEPQALEMMWSLTDNYPYFVQLVGAEVWKSLPKGGKRRVDVALVEQAKAEISRKRQYFYADIYHELNKGKLTSYALQTVETINRQKGATAMRRTIEAVLQQKNSALSEDDAMSIVDQMQRIGFIWQGGGNRMEAGIPSFFTYLQEIEQDFADEMGN